MPHFWTFYSKNPKKRIMVSRKIWSSTTV